MPSASNNNQSNTTKLVKQSSVSSMNSGGPSGTSAVAGSVSGKGNNKKITETSSKTNKNSTAPTVTAAALNNGNGNGNVETSSNKSAKDNTNNTVAAMPAGQNGKNWETNSAAGNSNAPSTTNKDAGNDALNPMKLTFTTIEHKIRNLEKRKTKLEGYRAIAALGKELSSDQKAAVDKYEAVIATLEFARDLVKTMQQFSRDAEKEQKKQTRKDLIAKAQAETVKIREVLIIQNILSCLTDEAVRSDFLNGEHGAAKLEPSELEIVEKFCLDVQTRRPETSADATFATSAQKAAEIFSMTIDARPKAYGEATYETVKRIFHRIQESDYLDKIYLTDLPGPEEVKEEIDIEDEGVSNDMEEGETGLQNEHQQQGDNEQEDNAKTVDALEEGMVNLNITENSNSAEVVMVNEMNENVMLVQQQHQLHHQQQQQMHQPTQQQPQLSEHQVDMPPQQQHPQQQQLAQQVPSASITNVGQPLIPTPMAPPASAVPAFQPTAPVPGHSGASTPVHVAMYGIPNMQAAQATQQQLQHVPPAQGHMGAGLPAQHVINMPPQQQPPNAAAGQQQQSLQRQMLTSPANSSGPVAGMVAPLQQAAPPTGLFNPTPVHAVEQTYFKQHQPHPQQPQQQHQQPHQQHQQYLQQMRPLAEVIGGGNFYFLQDSELDSPELNAQGQAGPQTTMIFEQQQQHQQPQNQQQVLPPQQQPSQLTPQQHQQPQMQQQPTQQQMLQTLQQQQQKTSANLLNEHQPQGLSNGVVSVGPAPPGSIPPLQQQPQQQHLQQNLNQSAPIPTQTFTNQSFPQMPPAQPQQASNLLASNTPSPLFHQQQQQPMQQQPMQQQPMQQPPQTQKPPQQQLFSPVQGQNLPHPQQQTPSQMHMSGSVDVQQPALMLMNRLAAGNPQNPLMQQQHQHLQQQQHHLHEQLQQSQQQVPLQPPPQVMMQQQMVTPSPQTLMTGMHQMPPNPQNATELNQTSKSAGFPFDNSVITGLSSYEQQLQNQQMQNQLNNAANVLKKSLGVRGADEDESKPPVIQKSDLINEWAQDGSGIKAPSVMPNNANPSDFNSIADTNKWTASSTPDVNSNSPLTVQQQTPQQSQRKNEWTSSATTGTSSGGSSAAPADSYANDSRTAEPTNHWHSQDSQGSYGRNSANRQQGGPVGGTQGNAGGYQRRNDDRRGGDDIRRGGNSGQSGGGGYRGRSNYNSGGPQQNGNGRGGNTASIYFRNNDNSNSSSFYQNGGAGGGTGGGGSNVYPNKDGGSRYESGGPGQYRGPRTAGNNAGNPRSSGPPPRHMSGSGGGGGGRSGGQPNNNTNSNSYMNSRQTTNRMPMGLENKN